VYSGSSPSKEKDRRESGRLQAMLQGRALRWKDESAERWSEVSEEGRQLVERLLVTDPSKRPSAAEALDSKWFSEEKAEALARTNLQPVQPLLRQFLIDRRRGESMVHPHKGKGGGSLEASMVQLRQQAGTLTAVEAGEMFRHFREKHAALIGI
jgi:serine/threonine protein kinase